MQLWRYNIPIERLGTRYRLIRPLGSGGMADVCLAMDEKNDREVAIKVLRSEQLDRDMLGRFMKEAALIAGWKHPNIIRIYDDVQWEVLDPKRGSLLPYIVMEYAQGGNLKERLKPDRPYPFLESMRLFSQICSAVQYAHEHDVVHRDIKPENVLFRKLPDGSENSLLSDFGMAVSLFATHHTFSHGGTPAYMAPEQLEGQAQPASDIYALGVLLYRLCTGRLPFEQIARAGVMPPPRPSSINTALSSHLDEIILTALLSDPAERFPSARIFDERVREAAASTSITFRTQNATVEPQTQQSPQLSNPAPQLPASEKSQPLANPEGIARIGPPDSQAVRKEEVNADSRLKQANIHMPVSDKPEVAQANDIKMTQASEDANAMRTRSSRSTGMNEISAIQPSENWSPPAGKTVNTNDVVQSNGGVSNVMESGLMSYRDRGTVFLPENRVAGAIPVAHPADTVVPPSRRASRGFGSDAGAMKKPLGVQTPGTATPGIASRSGSSGKQPQRFIPFKQNKWVGKRPFSRPRVLLLSPLLFLLTALVSGVVYASINPTGSQTTVVRPFLGPVPLGANPGSIHIVPDSKEVQDSYVMQAVTAQPDAAQLQIAMRNLEATPSPQTRTVTGTGHTQTQSVAAKGRLTFLNGSFQPFTVGSGTVISAKNGVSVATDQVAVIPAGVPGGANGSISVPAHAMTAGTAGNLDVGSINKGCCSAEGSVFVRNDAPFSGGVDSQSYTFVQQGDVNVAAAPLKETLSQQASAQFKQQIKGNEQLVGTPDCNSAVQVDPATVGDKGRNITSTSITVTAKCTGVAYDQGGAQAIAKERLQRKANSDPGPGYALVGNIATDVSISKVNQDSISLLVNAKGIWVYQIDDAKKQELAKQIAGKKVSEAQAYLNAQRSINNVKIEANGDTLPTNPNQITFNVQKIAGENVNNNNSNAGGNNGGPNGAATPASGKG